MGNFEPREPNERDNEYWDVVEKWVDERIAFHDLAIHALLNKIAERAIGHDIVDQTDTRMYNHD